MNSTKSFKIVLGLGVVVAFLCVKYWDFVCSNGASNFGTFLFYVTSSVAIIISGIFYFFRVRVEKRMEKRSNIAEEALNIFDHFIFQLNDWISKSSTCFIYSRHSNANECQYQQSSEEQKCELNRCYDKDPWELSNFCKNFYEIIKDFSKAKNRAFHLENHVLDGLFKELEIVLQNFKTKLCGYFRYIDFEDEHLERGQEAVKVLQFINIDGPEKVKSISEFIKEKLRRIMLFKE